MNTTSHGVVACRVRNVTVSGGCHGEANVSVLTQQRGRTLGEFRHQRDAMVTEPRRGQNERWLLRAAVTATSSRFSTPFAMWRNPRPAARHDHAQSQAGGTRTARRRIQPRLKRLEPLAEAEAAGTACQGGANGLVTADAHPPA